MGRLDNQFLQAEHSRSLVSENKIASIALGAIDCTIILQNILSSIVSTTMFLKYTTIAADDFHLELSWLNLTVFSVTKASETRVCFVRVQLSSLRSTIMFSLPSIFLFF